MLSRRGPVTRAPLASCSPELDAAIEAARAAGVVAIEHLGRAEFETKADGSIVTEADRQAEDAARRRLLAAFPAARIVGEETRTEDAVRALAAGEAWVIDPIDGTSSYTAQLPTFAVSVGLLREGEPVLGVLYLPLTDELYTVDHAGPARHDARPCAVVSPEDVDARAFFCTTSTSHADYRITFPGKVRSLGSTAFHVALVARGAAVGAVLEPRIWDVAAVVAILRRAGGDLFELDGGARLDVPGWVRAGSPTRRLLACEPRSLAPLRGFVEPSRG